MTPRLLLLSLLVVGAFACNGAPVANAGPDYTADPGSRTALDASASTDPDGDPLSFSWTQTAGPQVTLTINENGDPTFQAPFQSGGIITFKLTASDGHSTDEDELQVAIGGSGNRIPVVRAGNDQTVRRLATVNLNATANDANGDAMTYAWTQRAGPAVTLSDPTVLNPSFTAPDEVTDVTLLLTVNDGQRNARDQVVIHVIN